MVRGDSHVTLHYKVSLAEGGAAVIDTFGGRPATLQLGLGQMAEPLERRLLGLAEGEHRVFELPVEEAFGPRNPELVQRIARSLLDANAAAGTDWTPGDLVEFPGPEGGGSRFTAVLKSIDERSVLLDFNHPLAGQPLRFEVRILGVL